MNKKGIWRIIEAVIAVLILAGAMLLIAERQIENTRNTTHKQMRPFLDQVAKNQELREQILTDDQTSRVAENAIISLLEQKIPNIEFLYNVTICDTEDSICKDKLGYSDKGIKEVYTEARIISANIEFYQPKILRAYIWKE